MSNVLLESSSITLGEAFATGGQTALIGMGIVFSVLIILMIVLMLFKVIFYREPKKEAAPAPEPIKAEESADMSADMDEEELIAVLTAAVAASLNTSTYNLNIKSYRRINNTRPAWNKAGLNETINNRF